MAETSQRPAFARRSAGFGGTDHPQRLDHAFRLTVARPPTPAESTRLLAYLEQQKDLFAADAPAARELVHDTTFEGKPADQAARITLASVLLNLDEFINRE